MPLVPFDPHEARIPLREAINRLFEESTVWPRFEFFGARSFPVDIYESEDKKQYVIEAALPGIKPEEMQITAEGDTLTIHVQKKHEEKTEKGNYMRRERYEGEMTRTFSLPNIVDAENVQATFEHGILKLYIPKTETAMPKQIPVRVKEPAGAH